MKKIYNTGSWIGALVAGGIILYLSLSVLALLLPLFVVAGGIALWLRMRKMQKGAAWPGAEKTLSHNDKIIDAEYEIITEKTTEKNK